MAIFLLLLSMFTLRDYGLTSIRDRRQLDMISFEEGLISCDFHARRVTEGDGARLLRANCHGVHIVEAARDTGDRCDERLQRQELSGFDVLLSTHAWRVG